MKFKTENSFLYVEKIQFLNGEYKTTDKDEVAILKKYSDSISIIEEKPKVSDVIIGGTPEIIDETISKETTSKKTKE
ncbi:hypothetical protein [Clostridium estertheticum]|uniref:hypothetical protein n=1 Tax=Clostridium estertheticum TaxID=238834 RepID=UPI00124DF6CA|nr:hypothetical protein [Clostridium estertheticum]MBZ9616792.1 hypothetical protein [Clostridium estertheticum subsp. laramiense]WAG72499.1 hypothetical protein LL032_15240 [Clostridium estertheticum]